MLKLFFVVFSVRKDTKKEWTINAGYMFAKDLETIPKLLKKKYDTVYIRAATEIPIEEGTVLYGERWVKL